MPDTRMRVRVAPDRKSAALVTTSGRHSADWAELTLNELDELISELGNARSQMVEGQPSIDFESDKVTISTVANTTWCLRANAPNGVLIAFDHPKFGPVGFTLPRNQIAKIVSFLTNRFILQPTRSAGKH